MVVLQSEAHCIPMHTPLQHFDCTLASPTLHLHADASEQPAPSLPFSHEDPLLTSSIAHCTRGTHTHGNNTLKHFFFSLPVNRTDRAALLLRVLTLSCPLYSVWKKKNQSWFVGLGGCSLRRQTWTKALRTTTAVTP